MFKKKPEERRDASESELSTSCLCTLCAVDSSMSLTVFGQGRIMPLAEKVVEKHPKWYYQTDSTVFLVRIWRAYAVNNSALITEQIEQSKT